MSKQSRREAYAFYRSLGYSSKEAANIRNRSPKRLIEDYRTERVKYNEKRIENYKKEPEERKKIKPPYRPEIDATQTQIDLYKEYLDSKNLSEQIIDQLSDNTDIFDQDIYERRFDGFENFFESNDRSWDELMRYLAEIEDLGDFLDALGELYDEINGGE